MYGLELVHQSEGELKRGTVYVTLNRMEKKKFITSRKEEVASEKDEPVRRIYSITGAGVRTLNAYNRYCTEVATGVTDGVFSGEASIIRS
jgi:DNA-binding PadR family transcriptional regulator